jgi:hypothetical protein
MVKQRDEPVLGCHWGYNGRMEIGIVFLEKIKNARTTTSQRNLNEQENEAMVSDRTASVRG